MMRPAPHPNPRRWERTAKRIPILLAIRSQGQDQVRTVNTVNISKRGFRVKTDLALAPGQAVYTLPSAAHTPSGYCRVVWTQNGEAGLELVN